MRILCGFVILCLAVSLAGCAASPLGPVSDGLLTIEPAGLWGAPAKLTMDGHGFEPSIAADDFGRLFVTAHKSHPLREGDRTASWLWYSEDHGKTWKDMPTPLQVHESMPGLEGDLAVDDDNRIYFVDTYLGDNTLSVWRADEKGVTWESTRPIQGTVGLDDRPWLAAQGSGILYYLGDHVVAETPSPEGLLATSTAGSRWWFYRSMDAGRTWSAGLALDEIGFKLAGAPRGPLTGGMCNLDAGQTLGLVAVACSSEDGTEEFLLKSVDYGRSWTRVTTARVETAPGWLFPGVAVRPTGAIVTAWIDDNLSDDKWGRLKLALVDSNLQARVLDVTPQAASFSQLWLSVSPKDELLLNFHMAPELKSGLGRNWSMHAMQARIHDNSLAGVTWTLVDPSPVGQRPASPGHFFQNTFDSTGRPSLAYQRDIGFIQPFELRADVLVSQSMQSIPMLNAEVSK